MADTDTKRFSLAGLARATHMTLDWRNWAPSPRRFERSDSPPAEVLDKLIESEIIPRLMLANRGSELKPAPRVEITKGRPFSAEEVDRFARKAITADPELVIDDVEARLEAGASQDDILLRLLAPAARRLGQLWNEDEVDFTEVTIGLMKLHRVLQRVGQHHATDHGAGGSAPRILLAPALGEQHLLGVLMVGEFFSRSGWSVRCEPHQQAEHLIGCVAEEHFDVVGLSASTHAAAKALATEIREIRAASLNRDVIIMAGGPVFNDDIHLAKRIGADATAIDGLRAVVTAERLIHSLASSQRAPQ
jgi:methylmalonyl-CoA mutase cobalamin-binding domain/chain